MVMVIIMTTMIKMVKILKSNRDGALWFDIDCRVDGDVNDEVEEDDLDLQQVGEGWHVFVVQTMPFNLKNTYVK